MVSLAPSLALSLSLRFLVSLQKSDVWMRRARKKVTVVFSPLLVDLSQRAMTTHRTLLIFYVETFIYLFSDLFIL